LEPLQTIVLLEHKMSYFQVFLRYQSSGAGVWRFSGAYAPNVKYFRPEHKIARFGSRPCLVVTGQGISGTGVSSKIESWIDLTMEGLKPALSFTSQGHSLPIPSGMGRSTLGLVVSMAAQPPGRITVSYSVTFDAEDDVGNRRPVVERTDRVVYVRTAGGDFKLDEKLSTTTALEVERFYDVEDLDFDGEEFLRFNLRGLTELATSSDQDRRSWLTDFLEDYPDTPESRQLKTLLATR
jgi:hypothetical protein